MSNEDDYFEAGKLAGFQKGAAHERRAIVAWLRSGEVCPSPQVLAELIERGKHLRGEQHIDGLKGGGEPPTVTRGAGWVPGSATQVEPDSSRSKWGKPQQRTKADPAQGNRHPHHLRGDDE